MPDVPPSHPPSKNTPNFVNWAETRPITRPKRVAMKKAAMWPQSGVKSGKIKP